MRCGGSGAAIWTSRCFWSGWDEQAEFRHTGICGLSAVWTSATPFLVTRHMKRRGQKRDPREFFETPEGRNDFIKQVLREELERRGLHQDGVEIERLESVGSAASPSADRVLPAASAQARRRRTEPARVGSSGCDFRSRSRARSRSGTPAISAWGCSCRNDRGAYA